MVIDIQSVAELAKRFNLHGWQVEATALENAIHPTRYLRNMDSISPSAQARLLQSSAAQVGLGGLGGTLLETLLRTGIGRIRAADGDTFEESNLNRQALASHDSLDKPKAEAAQETAKRINPSVALDARQEFLTADSFAPFLEGHDIAIDALGGLASRLALQQAAAKADIPLVTGALAGWTGYVGVVMPGQSGPADIMGQDNAAEEQLGCPSPAVTCVASLMSAEVINLLTAHNSPLSGKMLIIDLKSLTFETITL